jgi:membrane protein YdbS with pleckstrin-like domain
LQENRIKLAVVILQISAVLSLLGVILFQSLLEGINSPIPNLVTGVVLAFAMLTAVLAFGLQRRKRWAWNVSVGLFALYVASGSVLLGAVGLWGLLDVGSRREFGVSDKPLLNI